MASITEMVKKGSDAVLILERVDELFKRVERQGAQIVELQSEVTVLKTLLEERTKSLERLMTERGNTIKAEVANEALETLGDKLYDLNDRFNEKLAGLEKRFTKSIEER
jgi:predicted  nucleic acid-binding Zn-ribbon protein